jgi:cation diffusion facilitator CzcD-associated flavoprotein CzcO
MFEARVAAQPEHVDVLIVGAGISGIGAAYYLQSKRPGTSYAIVEARAAIGGTWDLFRYPGIRSDSDLPTFGYAFKPWRSPKAIAGADGILDYLRETASENGIDRKIRYHHKVVSASWSSTQAKWLVQLERTDTGAQVAIRCNWLFCAGGYYRYHQGFQPQFAGAEQFRGKLIHPQHWPEDLDYSGKRVVVIGSGATAVTLIPSLAHKAAHVTMLQRTPTYVLSIPSVDKIAKLLLKLLPADTAHELIRRKNVAGQRALFNACRRFPRAARRLIRYLTAKQLPSDFAVDEHFNPPYDPWDQRLCIVPDGDLFKTIRKGKASVVTDQIECLTERGLKLKSGRELEADIIVTATGLNIQLLGGIQLNVDGEPVKLNEKLAFKGMMLSDVPNFAFAIGYTNASWTLKVGLLCEHFCRLLDHMDKTHASVCCPKPVDPNMSTRPLLDFGAGYVQRALSTLPRQGETAPWLMSMDYYLDVKLLRHADVTDENLKFYSPARERAEPYASATAAE